MDTAKLPNKKVLILHGHINNFGGVTSFYRKLSKLYFKSKYEIISIRVGSVDTQKWTKIFIFRQIGLFFDYLIFIYKLLVYRPNIVHINPSLDRKSIYRDLIYVIISRFFNNKIKIVTHMRGWYESIAERFQKKKILNFALNYIFLNSDAIIVLAKKFKMSLLNFSIDSDKIFVIPTAANVNDFNKNFSNAYIGNTIRILFLSRLSKDKGLREIGDSINDIVERNKDKKIKFIFAGDGRDKKYIENYIIKLGVEEHVKFMGYVRGNAKINLFLQSDIFLFPSYCAEGCPNAVIEAMAAGLPIVSTNVGALEEIIENRVNGILVEKYSVEQIVDAINLLIKNSELRKRIGENNRKKAIEEFSIHLIFQKIEGIYDELLVNNSL